MTNPKDLFYRLGTCLLEDRKERPECSL